MNSFYKYYHLNNSNISNYQPHKSLGQAYNKTNLYAESFDYIYFYTLQKKRKLNVSSRNNYRNIPTSYYFSNYSSREFKVKFLLNTITDYVYALLKYHKIKKYILSRCVFIKKKILRKGKMKIIHHYYDYTDYKTKKVTPVQYRYVKIRSFYYKVLRKIKRKYRKRRKKFWSNFFENPKYLKYRIIFKKMKRFMYKLLKKRKLIQWFLKKNYYEITYFFYYILVIKWNKRRRKRRRRKKRSERKLNRKIYKKELLVSSKNSNFLFKSKKRYEKPFNLLYKNIFSNFIKYNKNELILHSYIDANYIKLTNYFTYLFIRNISMKKIKIIRGKTNRISLIYEFYKYLYFYFTQIESNKIVSDIYFKFVNIDTSILIKNKHINSNKANFISSDEIKHSPIYSFLNYLVYLKYQKIIKMEIYFYHNYLNNCIDKKNYLDNRYSNALWVKNLKNNKTSFATVDLKKNYITKERLLILILSLLSAKRKLSKLLIRKK